MKTCIVVSKRDLAGLNIARVLIEEFGFEESSETFQGNPVYLRGEAELIIGSKDIIFIDDPGRNVDIYVYASRHRSEKSVPCLTIHPTGNFSLDSSHGGEAKTLGLTNSLKMKAALVNLARIAEEFGLTSKYSVSLEVTHHGPTNLAKPLFFIEVGSTPREWSDLKACRCVSKAIIETIEDELEGVSSIGIGGPHYAPVFTKKALATEYAVGHICPKYHVNELTLDLIQQMIEKTHPKPRIALIDWKGLRGEDRRRIIDDLSSFELEVVKA